MRRSPLQRALRYGLLHALLLLTLLSTQQTSHGGCDAASRTTSVYRPRNMQHLAAMHAVDAMHRIIHGFQCCLHACTGYQRLHPVRAPRLGVPDGHSVSQPPSPGGSAHGGLSRACGMGCRLADRPAAGGHDGWRAQSQVPAWHALCSMHVFPHTQQIMLHVMRPVVCMGRLP